MRRRYTSAEYGNLVEKLRDAFPDVGITTDIMVGFPGETDEHFEESFNFVDDVGFSQLHVFRYSPRRGTPAANYLNQVPPDVSAARSRAMIHLGRRLGLDFRRRMLGKHMNVLVEDSREGRSAQLSGFTPNYLRVLMNAPALKINQIISVTLTGFEDAVLQGETVDEGFQGSSSLPLVEHNPTEQTP